MLRQRDCYTVPCLVVLVFVMLCSIRCYSTTAVVIVDDSGIVIATDSKVVHSIVVDARRVKTGEQDERKIFIVQNHFAIVCIGHVAYKLGHNEQMVQPPFDYDFSTRIQEIQRGLPDNIPFDDFVGVINEEIRKTMPKVAPFVGTGGVSHKSTWDIFEPFAHFVIAGFEKGVPKLCVLEFYLDWNTKLLLGPYQTTVEPNAVASHTRGYFFGASEAASAFRDQQSYAHKRAAACCSEAMGHLVGSHTRLLSTKRMPSAEVWSTLKKRPIQVKSEVPCKL